jgi:hypothetical protein
MRRKVNPGQNVPDAVTGVGDSNDPPIESCGRSLRFDPERMEGGKPYTVLIEGHTILALKNARTSVVSFYYLPEA